MDQPADITKVKDLVDKAQSILLVTHENPTFDSIGSTLALGLGLKDLGKKITVAIPDPVTVEFSNFVGVNKIVNEMKRKNFIISLDYVDGSIEKVSYNIEGEKFNLVIEPRNNFDIFSPEKVHYSYAGPEADLIITVDTIHLGGLKKLYESDRDFFASKPIINIDRHANNNRYGQVNIVDAQVATTAELVSSVLASLGVRLTEDIATNTLNALYGGTNNFQSQLVTARTFDLAASCVKAGGKKFQRQATTQEETPKAESALPASPAVTEIRKTQTDKHEEPAKPPEAPADWLKPKIFKSSSLV